MPIPLGILAAAGVRAAGGSYELIETITVGSGGAASVTFSNLNTYSSTYQHLQVRMVTRTDSGGAADVLTMTFNGVGGTSYASHLLFGNGSSVTSAADVVSGAYMQVSRSTGATSGSGIFSPAVVDILDPYETTKNKTVRSLSGIPDRIELYSGVFMSTNAISSITIDQRFGSNFAQYSRFSLYGLKAS